MLIVKISSFQHFIIRISNISHPSIIAIVFNKINDCYYKPFIRSFCRQNMNQLLTMSQLSYWSISNTSIYRASKVILGLKITCICNILDQSGSCAPRCLHVAVIPIAYEAYRH